MFTGSDILKIVVAVGLSRCGYPLEAVHVVADAVVRHASNKLAGRTDQPGLVLFSYPIDAGKTWRVTPLWESMESEPQVPPFAHAVQADVVVDEVLRRLQALTDEAPGPTGPLKFLPGWTSERTLVGLNEAETAEISELASQANASGRNPHKHPRYRELWAKYNKAFQELLAADVARQRGDP